jgi:hypothetical protein
MKLAISHEFPVTLPAEVAKRGVLDLHVGSVVVRVGFDFCHVEVRDVQCRNHPSFKKYGENFVDIKCMRMSIPTVSIYRAVVYKKRLIKIEEMHMDSCRVLIAEESIRGCVGPQYSCLTAAGQITPSIKHSNTANGGKDDVSAGEVGASSTGAQSKDKMKSMMESFAFSFGGSKGSVGGDGDSDNDDAGDGGMSSSRLVRKAVYTSYMKGWLKKEGSVFKSWKKRFFVVTLNSISYYTSSTSFKSQKGFIPLTPTTKILPGEESLDGTLFYFSLHTPKRNLYLCASTEEERFKWMDVLHSVVRMNQPGASIADWEAHLKGTTATEEYPIVDIKEVEEENPFRVDLNTFTMSRLRIRLCNIMKSKSRVLRLPLVSLHRHELTMTNTGHNPEGGKRLAFSAKELGKHVGEKVAVELLKANKSSIISFMSTVGNSIIGDLISERMTKVK